ncbi:conserved hypothetical protein [Histoplasma capsulatum G186AR]|uniref:Uncharacterized protein n=2 Tax=Ajellomyces capsulatus TaxID=5037 RepID=C0NKX9_AJECG|nr:uncharacterized protein HCBG_03809 [Histoplasma capsulatum G186AR]EEH08520.1 conserved hypothetical protein [Histoplasma capsulatum G186AR]KAG5299169.1 hypothetical protein I7I52_09385 [Histoplasma capsulatum]QSS68211.1 hypothetical protein I7I50_07543 [Histoplasma capsulatum G186AR]
MPTPPRRPSNRGRAKSTPHNGKPLDIGQPLGVHDINSVREKVRRWQQQGGGVITENDVGPESDSFPESRTGKQNSPTTKKHSRTKEGSKNKENNVQRARSNSTPRKRVISDEHWRKNRSPPASLPQKVTHKRKTDVFDRYGKSTSTTKEKEKTCGHSGGTNPSSNPLPGDGIRVYATSVSSSRRSERPKSRHTCGSQSILETEVESSVGDQTSAFKTQQQSQPRKQKGHDYGARDVHLRKRPGDDEWSTEPSEVIELSEQENRSRRQTHKLPPRTLRPPKGGIFNHVIDESKKIFGKHEPSSSPVPAPRNHGSNVEAWLSSTPDPFTEDEDLLVQVPLPLDSRSRRKDPSQSDYVDDSGSFRSSLQAKNTKGRRGSKGNKRNSKSPPSTEGWTGPHDGTIPHNEQLSEISGDTRESSPPTLRRTGARKRPNSFTEAGKMSTLQESLDEALQGSNLDLRSSDGSEVSISDRPPPLTLRRPFPGTGAHRLSTIMSVDTLSTRTETACQNEQPTDLRANTQTDHDGQLESEARDQFDPNSLPGPKNGLKRRLTTHADLISVLSIPGDGSRSIRSARSIRTNRSRLATATIDDIMQEFSSDEAKYMRELRTLVGGVIPVLLTSVLSKSDSAIAAGLFRPSGNPRDDENFTRPIVDMGISLERLNSLHKRAPLNNPEALLSWAQGAQKVYRDYLKAWRLGFQDVIVNLAPPDDDPSNQINPETQSLYAGMAQDEDGDVVNGDGEKVDVAFLLKRPLVRLKYLSKTFKGINYVRTSPKAEEMAMVYQSLVTDARRRSNEERARLEDDMAAAIDATRARNPRNLAVLADIAIHKTRRVRARDFFNLSLLHSTGQQIDCRAELLLRDNPPNETPGGDLLICEVDDTGRWLLFPPIDRGRASARNGDGKGEIIIMIRGVPGEEKDWKELITFKTDDEQIGFEWVQMIGLSPVPPKIDRSMSFINRAKARNRPTRVRQEGSELSTVSEKRSPSPTDMDVPIGEQATVVSLVTGRKAHIGSDTEISRQSLGFSRDTYSPKEPLSVPHSRKESENISLHTPTKPRESVAKPRSLNEAMDMAGGVSPTNLRRSKAKRRPNYGDLSMSSPPSSGTRTPEKERGVSDLPFAGPKSPETKSTYPQETGLAGLPIKRGSSPEISSPKPQLGRPLGRRSLSPVPSLELPLIPKIRKGSPQSSLATSPPKEETPAPSITTNKVRRSPAKRSEGLDEDILRRDLTVYTEDVPLPPPHSSPSPTVPRHSTPVLSPTSRRNNQNRRSSSPLKHEYEPSTATESPDSSDTSTIEHHEINSSSETSDEELEGDDNETPLPPVGARQLCNILQPSEPPTDPEGTLGPSNSASQSPCKSIPLQPSKSAKSIAFIFSWNEKGTWEALYPDECSIVITPGLIEAYEMNFEHSQRVGPYEEDTDSGIPSEKPLIALELTPLVPIRRGTALDISIRSPPTTKSQITTGNNIMFRSRNPEECEKLYGLINHSRINNPTYIALQNARGPYSVQPTSLARQNSNRRSRFGGWFNWSSSSYRASSAPAPSVAGVTDSSVGTMSSAFSALKKFGAGSKMFSIARSTITSRTGSQRGSLYSTSTRSGSTFPNSPFETGYDLAKNAAGGIGLSNAKIRLYARESASKWRDMGAARLTILHAPSGPSRPGTAGTNRVDAGISPADFGNMEPMTPDGQPSAVPAQVAPAAPVSSARRDEKRILIRGKTKGEVLLDVCLGESNFERVARTGIAVSVWERYDGVAKEGGVVSGNFKVYMIQMKSEAETAYTFGLVGKLRY